MVQSQERREGDQESEGHPSTLKNREVQRGLRTQKKSGGEEGKAEQAKEGVTHTTKVKITIIDAFIPYIPESVLNTKLQKVDDELSTTFIKLRIGFMERAGGQTTQEVGTPNP